MCRSAFECEVMKTMLFLIGFLAITEVPGSFGSFNDEILQVTPKEIFGAAYADGYRQILAANLPPDCKENALNELAAAHDAGSSMNCNGFVNNTIDIGEIILTALNSTGQLVQDLNTMINSVPMCWDSKSWYNLPGKIACVFTQFSNVWDALKDFYHFKNYATNTLDVIIQYVNCKKASKVAVSKNVQIIVETAKLCR